MSEEEKKTIIDTLQGLDPPVPTTIEGWQKACGAAGREVSAVEQVEDAVARLSADDVLQITSPGDYALVNAFSRACEAAHEDELYSFKLNTQAVHLRRA